MKVIPLSKGKSAIVDDEDWEFVSQWKWHFNAGYAMRSTGSNKTGRSFMFMHRLLANTPTGMETDHINGDKLDNRKSNLRVVTSGENRRNKGKLRTNTSGYLGVVSSRGIWVARIKNDHKTVHLGSFKTPEEAYAARMAAAPVHHGEFAHA